MSLISRYGTLAVIVLCAFAFASAGIAKIMGSEQVLKSFADLGLPGWFGLLIAVCELAGAVGLLVRPLSGLAAAGLFVIMLGAIYYHLTYPPVQLGIPALILAILTAYIFFRRRTDILKF